MIIAWSGQEGQSPYLIMDTQEIKTTWHPVENIAGRRRRVLTRHQPFLSFSIFW